MLLLKRIHWYNEFHIHLTPSILYSGQRSGISENSNSSGRTQLSPPITPGLNNGGFEMSEGRNDDKNNRQTGQQTRSISDYSLNLNNNSPSPLDSTPRGGYLENSINSGSNILTDRRKSNGSSKKRFERIKTTRRQISARLLQEQKKNLEVHVIDKISRYLYPISFAIYNVIYFTYAFVQLYSKK